MNRMQIVLSDETKAKIKKMAKANKRTIGKEIEFILEHVKRLGIAEGRGLEAESFNLAQMPNRITND